MFAPKTHFISQKRVPVAYALAPFFFLFKYKNIEKTLECLVCWKGGEGGGEPFQQRMERTKKQPLDVLGFKESFKLGYGVEL